MLKEQIDKSLQTIKILFTKIYEEREILRNNRVKLLYSKLRINNESRVYYEELLEKNKILKQEKSQLMYSKNKETLEQIRETDPKLFVLIKKYQTAEQQNLNYKLYSEEKEEEKKTYINEYNVITQSFLSENALKTKIQDLEDQCKIKASNINTHRNKLAYMKQEIINPSNDLEEVKNLMSLYEELLKEKLRYCEENTRMKLDLEEINTEINQIQRSPKKIYTPVKVKDEIKRVEKKISNLNLHIKNTEKVHDSPLTECNSSYQNKKTNRSSSFIKHKDLNTSDTERNIIVKNLGKELEEGRSHKALSVLRSLSKPGTPAATRLVELNRSRFIYKY